MPGNLYWFEIGFINILHEGIDNWKQFQNWKNMKFFKRIQNDLRQIFFLIIISIINFSSCTLSLRYIWNTQLLCRI